MGTIWAKDFTGGLDSRRLEETTPDGTLLRAFDCHITRGGEAEVRAAFVPVAFLPPNTFGLFKTSSNLVVFGDTAFAPVPSGVVYQRLQHPSGVPLSRVLSCDLYADKVYAVGLFADGSRYHFYDGQRVTDWFDGRARAVFTFTSGGGGLTITGITVGGVEVLGATVSWAGSAQATAAAVAAQINTFSSTPNYTAVATDATVAIVHPTAGATPNGSVVLITASTGITYFPPTNILLSGGTATTSTPGSFVKTVGRRMFSVSGSVLHASAIDDPTKWQTTATGAAFFDVAREVAGAETLVSLADYSGFLAVLAERAIIIYTLDSDPANIVPRQRLPNTGTIAARSVLSYGDTDAFYLDESGVRSLKARDSSNAAFASDIGSAIDPAVLDYLDGLTAQQRADAISLVEPRDGRLWIIVNDRIFVFSYFTGSKISAWSIYRPGFSITDATEFQRKVYVRSGDVIYAYGGPFRTPIYDSTQPEIWLPYYHAGTPSKKKGWVGYDVACRGTWQVRAAMEPANVAASDLVGTVERTTFNEPSRPLVGTGTHLSLRFTGTSSGYKKLGSVVLHFEDTKDEK